MSSTEEVAQLDNSQNKSIDDKSKPVLSTSPDPNLPGVENEINCDGNLNLYQNGSEDQLAYSMPIADNMSIEIFFGNITSLYDFYNGLEKAGLDVTTSESKDMKVEDGKVGPSCLRKLVLVGHPLKSFNGLSRFSNLSEAWITNTTIKEGKASDFIGLDSLYRLYIYSLGLEILEPLPFSNLRILWVAGNKLQSLSFLGGGMSTLFELNIANNEIVRVQEEHIFKCFNLITLNLSGNPIATVHEVQALKVLPCLRNLSLADPLYGKCPLSLQPGSRFTLLTILNPQCSLDGRTATQKELSDIQEYINTRSLFYYNTPIRTISLQACLRKSAMNLANKKLENIGTRILNLLALAARYRRSLLTLEITPIFTNAKTLMKDQLSKLEDRVVKLKECSAGIIKRLETIMQLSHWEQEMVPWLKWIEFQSFGNTTCDIIYSVHGARNGNSSLICSSMHQILSSLTCPGHWPKNDLLKIESVIIFKDSGMESNLNFTHEKHFLRKQEPEFVPPPVEDMSLGGPSNSLYYQASKHYNLSRNQKLVDTYMRPDYKPSAPLHNFPDSVPGLLEKSQPIFMFLMIPTHSGTNPFAYLHRLINEKSKNYRDIRLTNCLWIALQNKPTNFTVVIVVKVLFECIQPLAHEKRGTGSMHHQWDCTTFCVNKPMAIAPVYIINISFTPEESSLWQIGKASAADDDILLPARAALSTLTENKARSNSSIKTAQRRSPYIRKVSDGVLGDLSCAHLIINGKGEIGFKERTNLRSKSSHLTFPNSESVENISKVLGTEASQVITSLDLSGNNLTVIVGLDGLNALKKLNLSHNKLQGLKCLKRLSQLTEFKVSWNLLKNFENAVQEIHDAFPSLMALDLLPNPFQDLREVGHIPVILRRIFPVLHKVDIWKAPFNSSTTTGLSAFNPPNYSSRFDHVAMAKCWSGNAYAYNDLASKCLYNLNNLPPNPPFPEGFGTKGLDLNLSDNYLDTYEVAHSSFIQLTEWRCSIVKLQLQENNLCDLDWMRNRHFPNLQILNLSNNFITSLELIPLACPSLRHLQLSGNPLPAEVHKVLSPLHQLDKLTTLDCSGSPLASAYGPGPMDQYRTYVMQNFKSVHIIDGIPTKHLEIARSIEDYSGSYKDDWLSDKFRSKSVMPLIDIKLPTCTIQEVILPPQGVSTLKTATNAGAINNSLTTFSSLASLSSLRVLCLSHNNTGLTSMYPTCFSVTSDSKAQRKSKYPSQEPAWKLGSWSMKTQNETEILNSFQYSPPPTVANPLAPVKKTQDTKGIVPKLEVLILPVHSLEYLSDLNLTALPQLQDILDSCMEMNAGNNLESTSTIRAILIDNNRIPEDPYHSIVLSGTGGYLKYLHMQHNRICAIPRLPHLTSMAALFVGYNKIQNFNDISSLVSSGITDLSLLGNSISAGMDYRLRVATQMNQLQTSDNNTDNNNPGNTNINHNLLHRKFSSPTEFSSKWFPAAASMIRDYTTGGTASVTKTHITTSTKTTFREFRGLVENRLELLRTHPEFDLRIMSPQLAKRAPRNTTTSSKGNFKIFSMPPP